MSAPIDAVDALAARRRLVAHPRGNATSRFFSLYLEAVYDGPTKRPRRASFSLHCVGAQEVTKGNEGA